MSKKCLACGYDNRDGAGFCTQCSSQLPGGSGAGGPQSPVVSALPVLSFAGSPPQAYLVNARQRFLVQDTTTLIGRGAGCHIVLNDASVSANHAEIVWDGTDYVVNDLSSTNGTWVNGKRIATGIPLRSGTQLFFGTVGFSFEYIGTNTVSSTARAGATQAISPQQMQSHISRSASVGGSGIIGSHGQPRVSGKVLSEPTERQEQPPPDPARTLVMLAVVLLFVGMLCSFVATLLTLGIILLVCGGAALLFIVPFLWMPVQMLFDNVIRSIRDEKPVTAVSFQVQDDSTGYVYDVGFIRKGGMGGGGLHLGDKVEVWGKQRGGNQIQANKILIVESHGLSTSVVIPIRKGWPLVVGILAVALVFGGIGYVAVALGLVELSL